jgi:hypothetical protein
MSNLDGRLRGVDRVPVPELWDDIEIRPVRHQPEGRGRTASIAVALVVTTALVVPLAITIAGRDRSAPSTAPDALFFPTQREPAATQMQALFRGELVVRDDCVLASAGSEYVLPIWPVEFTVNAEDGGGLIVNDADGEVVAVEGERFEMGGGYIAEFSPADEVKPRATQLAGVESLLGTSIPQRCVRDDVHGVWSVGETRPGIAVDPSPSGAVSSGPRVGAMDDVVYLAPYLRGGAGWHVQQSSPAGEASATVAWASNVPLLDRLNERGTPAIPIETIASLPPEGIIITVLTVPSEFDPAGGPYPYGDLDLHLSSGEARGPRYEEPEGNYSVIEIDAPPALVRAYFGATSPSQSLVEAAQVELDTLQLPPVCGMPARGGYGAELSIETGMPGYTATISGPTPFQREDGSYSPTDEAAMVAWWNAAPDDWALLASFSTTPPPPAVGDSPLLHLGEDRLGACSFVIRFTVPDVAPGLYPIVVLQDGPDGATRAAVLRFQVT